MKKVALMMLAVAAGTFALAGDAVQVLFPYTIVGRVVDRDNCAFDANSQVTLKISAVDGTVLAQTSVYTPNTVSAYNFRLAVPVASSPTPGYAVKGDTLVMTAIKDGVVYTGFLKGDDAKIGSAGASVVVRILLAPDANYNGIDDDYENSMAALLAAYGLDGEYDPDGDYDKDGFSNRNEYLAGTNPFDAGDYLGVKTMVADADDENYLKITFETNPGRTYSLKESADVKAAASNWTRGNFKTDPSSQEVVIRLVNSRTTWEPKTIYLLKQGPQRFYKLELEQE